jgi:predicted Zn-dependent peptidase
MLALHRSRIVSGRRAASLILLALFLGGGLVPPFGPSSARAAADFASWQSQVKEYRLSNGLLLLVVERPFAPIFSFVTWVDAGGVDAPSGKTGIAHMMEHMAFKGTPTIGTTDAAGEAKALQAVDEAWDAVVQQKRLAVLHQTDSTKTAQALDRFKTAQEEAARFVVGNAFSKILDENGVQDINASTGADQTTYYYSLPANKLELWALLEGDRMTYPVFREFYKEREVVIEERRMGTESSPRGRLRQEVWQTAYGVHPYRNGVIGFRSDLENFGRRDAESFFREHYNAANMVVVVVGDVKGTQVRELGEKYFSGLPNGPKNEPILAIEPPPAAERTVRTTEEAQPSALVAYYGGPDFNDPNYLATDALVDVLGGGRSSRLYTSLVKQQRLAANVSMSAGFPGRKYPNVIWCNLAPAPGVASDTLVAALQRELDGLADRPVTEKELTGYRNRSLSGLIEGLHSNNGLAFQLAFYQTRTGDWRNLFRVLDRINALTPAMVTAQAGRIFTRTHRTVGIMDRAPRAAEGGKS